MLQEKVIAKGLVSFVLMDKDGNIKQEETHNTIMDVGLAYIAQRTLLGTGTTMSHLAIGTSSANSGDSTQTVLGGEIARVAFTSATQVTTTVTNDTMQFVATFNAGTGTGALVEAGIFNNATANTGTMLARTVFSVINKGVDDSLTITWKITIA
jgi:hypothetical protein